MSQPIPQPAVRPGDTIPVFRRREGPNFYPSDKLWGVVLKASKTNIEVAVREVTSIVPELVDGILCYPTEIVGAHRLDYDRKQVLQPRCPVVYATDGDGTNGRYVCELWPEGADQPEAVYQRKCWADARERRGDD